MLATEFKHEFWRRQKHLKHSRPLAYFYEILSIGLALKLWSSACLTGDGLPSVLFHLSHIA
jgi:hypothetical protein